MLREVRPHNQISAREGAPIGLTRCSGDISVLCVLLCVCKVIGDGFSNAFTIIFMEFLLFFPKFLTQKDRANRKFMTFE